MKKIIVLLLFSLILFSCSDSEDEVNIEKIELSSSELYIEEGGYGVLVSKVFPETATEKLQFISSDENIATVNSCGLVEGLKKGKCKISACSSKGIKQYCDVEVTECIPIKGIKLNRSDVYLKLGETVDLDANFIPSNTTKRDIRWETSDIQVASVDENGLVTAKNNGDCYIRARSLSNKEITQICKIHCTDREIRIKNIELNIEYLTLMVGQTFQVVPRTYPENATETDLRWSSYDPEYAEVSINGLITGVSPGETIIEVSGVLGGAKEICYVTVVESNCGEFIDDRDGHVYKTVKIGEQIWMAENLAYLGDEILIHKSEDYSFEGCYSYVYGYEGTSKEEVLKSENYKKYGVLYGYKQAIKAVPEGWHIPTDQEWQELEIYLGMDKEEAARSYDRPDYGYKLKSQYGWEYNCNGSNEFNFNALPAGFRGTDYQTALYGFLGEGAYTYFWSSTPVDDMFIYCRYLDTSSILGRVDCDYGVGISLRLIKD